MVGIGADRRRPRRRSDDRPRPRDLDLIRASEHAGGSIGLHVGEMLIDQSRDIGVRRTFIERCPPQRQRTDEDRGRDAQRHRAHVARGRNLSVVELGTTTRATAVGAHSQPANGNSVIASVGIDVSEPARVCVRRQHHVVVAKAGHHQLAVGVRWRRGRSPRSSHRSRSGAGSSRCIGVSRRRRGSPSHGCATPESMIAPATMKRPSASACIACSCTRPPSTKSVGSISQTSSPSASRRVALVSIAGKLPTASAE